MKVKKVFITLAIVLLGGLFFVSTSHAGWFYSLNIIKISSEATGEVLTVENDAGTFALQKYLAEANANTLLAIILTAQGLGSKVHVFLDTGTDEFTGVILSNE